MPLLVLSETFRGFHVNVFSDNTATVSFINRSTTKNAAALKWLKLVFYASVRHNFRFSATHMPGSLNVTADALSRLTVHDRYADVLTDLKNFSSLPPIKDPLGGYYPVEGVCTLSRFEEEKRDCCFPESFQ